MHSFIVPGKVSKFSAETLHGVSDSYCFTEKEKIWFKFCFDRTKIA